MTEPTDRQKDATAALDAAIKECWEAYAEENGHGFTRTEFADLMVTEWTVLVGVLGNEESTVDYLMPHFPSIPMHHVKGLLVEALDQLSTPDIHGD